MRSKMLILLLALLAATQAHAVKGVTVQQLSGEIASFGKQSDAKAAAKALRPAAYRAVERQ